MMKGMIDKSKDRALRWYGQEMFPSKERGIRNGRECGGRCVRRVYWGKNL